ncbi:Cytochrome c oxidase subunit NDUFA4 [Pitangus sulphuratus]|nr:Cytochrome c oxidase subunit NDUFA4 [Pitangus sulphuratus]
MRTMKLSCLAFKSPLRLLTLADGEHTALPSELIPLFVIIGSGGVGAGLYLMRLAMFNPEVSWDRKNNPEPWNKLSPSDQYKTMSRKIAELINRKEMEFHPSFKLPTLVPLSPQDCL